MNETKSILLTIKKLLGISDDDHSYDVDVILHINSILSILNQVGVGADEGFAISGDKETWDEYIAEDYRNRQSMVVSYIYLRVKLLFDPPSSSFVLESMKSNISEMEWRLSISKD